MTPLPLAHGMKPSARSGPPRWFGNRMKTGSRRLILHWLIRMRLWYPWQRNGNNRLPASEWTGSTRMTLRRSRFEGETDVDVNIRADQRTRIHDVILSRRDIPRVNRVDFDIRVGTVIPR